MQSAHDLGTELFGPENYTVEHREFTDGDSRTIVSHAIGWSSTNFINIQVWMSKSEVWVDYHEHDCRRSRTIMPLDEFDAEKDPGEYIRPNA